VKLIVLHFNEELTTITASYERAMDEKNQVQ